MSYADDRLEEIDSELNDLICALEESKEELYEARDQVEHFEAVYQWIKEQVEEKISEREEHE